jgi:CPA2 family monovalent cation:H+ antiporter-2
MALKILQQARHHRVDLPILVRTMNVSDSKRLRDARATEILPEALETSVFMGAQLLSLMGVPRSRIQEHKETVRESEYQLLHQIFADATTSSTKEHPEEALQTVRLPEKADAVGHTPASLGLLDRGVMLLAIIPIL